MSAHSASCACDHCYWSAPWRFEEPDGAWRRFLLEQAWSEERSRRQAGHDREDRLRRRWDDAVTDRRGSEPDRAHRECSTLAEILHELWALADLRPWSAAADGDVAKEAAGVSKSLSRLKPSYLTCRDFVVAVVDNVDPVAV